MAVDVRAEPVLPATPRLWARRVRGVVASLSAVVLALLVGAAILAIVGGSPLRAYAEMLRGAIGSRFAIGQLLIQLVPLLMIGLGLAIAFRARIWNIGAEGQFHLGALAGGALAIYLPLSVPWILMPVAMLGGAAGGAFLGWVVGWMRSRWSVNEIISSLLLNYVAIYVFLYMIRQPMKDPASFLPQSEHLPQAALLPRLPGLGVHIGLFVALGLVPIFAYVLNRTPFGFRTAMVGANPDAAEAAGANIGKLIVRVMGISGALAGLAGIVQAMGVQTLLQEGISGGGLGFTTQSGYGYTAIVVALLGRMRPFGVLFASLFIAGLTTGGRAMQLTERIPLTAVFIIQALFILFLLAADKLVRRK